MDESTRKLFEQADARLELLGYDSVEKAIIFVYLYKNFKTLTWICDASDDEIAEFYADLT